MEQDGGVKMKLMALPKPQGIGIVGAPTSRPPASAIQQMAIETYGRDVKSVKEETSNSQLNSELYKLLTIGQRDLAVISFGEDVVRALESNGTITRYIWAPENNDLQCNSSIGRVEYDKTHCWICGFSIPNEKYPHGLLAECEHVLPIAQAVMVLGLYNNRASKEENDAISHLLSMEYGWSHSICNQTKNDDTYYSLVGDSIAVDDSKIQNLLTEIYRSKRKDAELLKNKIDTYPGGVSEWRKASTQRIHDVYENILNFLTKTATPQPGLTMLAWLASARIVPGSESIGSIRQKLFNKESIAIFTREDPATVLEIANKYSQKLDEIIKLYSINGKDVRDVVNSFRSEPETRLSLFMRSYKKGGEVFALQLLYLIVCLAIQKKYADDLYTKSYIDQIIKTYLTPLSSNSEVSNYLKEIFNKDALLSTLGPIFGGARGRKTFRRKHNGRSVRKATVRRNVSTSKSNRKVRTSTGKRS